MGWFRKKYEQVKGEVKDEFKHRSQVKAIEKESYRKAQIREAKRFGAKKAKYESEQRVKSMRQPKPGYTYKGFAGPTSRQPVASMGVGEYLTSGGSKRNTGDISQINILGGTKRKGKGVSQDLKNMGL